MCIYMYINYDISMTHIWSIRILYVYIYIWNHYLSTCWFMLKDDDAKWCYGSLAFLACEYTYIIHLYVGTVYRFHRWPFLDCSTLFHKRRSAKYKFCELIHINFRIILMGMGPSRNGFVFFTKKCWSSFHGINKTWQWSSSLALSMIDSKRFNPARIFPPITSQTQIWQFNPTRADNTTPVLFVLGDLKSWKGMSDLMILIQSFR